MLSRISLLNIRPSSGLLRNSTPSMVRSRHEALPPLSGGGERALSHAPAISRCGIRRVGDPMLLGCAQADDFSGVLRRLPAGPTNVSARGGGLYLVRPGLLWHVAMDN